MIDLPEARWVAVDTETSGMHPDDGAAVSTVSIAWLEDGQIHSRAFPFDQGMRDKIPNNQLELLDERDPNLGKRDWVLLLRWLLERRIIMHNAKFDLMMLRYGTRHWAGTDLSAQLTWDTMLAGRELEPLELAGLEASCKRHDIETKTNVDEMAAWLSYRKLPTRRYDLVPWSIIAPYAAGDARMTYALMRKQLALTDMQDQRLLAKLARDIRLTLVLGGIERRGVGYRAAESLEAAAVLEARADEIERALPFKGPKEAGRWFFDKCGVKPMHRSEKTGAPSLDEEQVRRMVAENIPAAVEYGEATKIRRAVAMWYRGYPDKTGPDGRLRCSYRQTAVKSGRMSVERVQLQAIPKNDKAIAGVPTVRSLIVPAPGHALWNLDLSQAELRVAAKYARCTPMLELLESGADLHSITTRSVLGAEPTDPDWKAKRDIGKRLTFGSIFQIGGATFQATLGKLANIYLPIAECDTLVRRWRGLYPEFEVAYRRAERVARKRRWVRLLPNTEHETRSWFLDYHDDSAAWSRIVQGSLAELLKLWLVAADEAVPRAIVLTVHDSIVLELPEHDETSARKVADIGAALGTRLFGIDMFVEAERWAG